MRRWNFFPIFILVILFTIACQRKSGSGAKLIVVEPRTEKIDISKYDRVIYVGNNKNKSDGSKENPYNKIEEALNASNGKTALLVSKTDTLTGTIVLKNDVHLFGGFNPKDWKRDINKYRTSIEGFFNNRLIIAAENNIIDGFTLSGGRVEGNGAAILCDGVSPEITNNYFVNNQTIGPDQWDPKYWHETANDGGAVYCTNGASPIIEHNIFVRNTTINGRGAAVAADGRCEPIIRNNVFFENAAGLDDPMRSSDGGALSIFRWCDAVIEGNIFVSNKAHSKNDGGGIFLALWSSAKVKNNLFVDNHAGDDAGAIFVGGQEHRYGGAPLDPIPNKDEFFVSIEGNTFIGNHHGGINSGAMRFTMESRGEFINNKLAQNNGVYFQRSEVRVAENIILDNFLFIETKEGLNKGIIENNLFWADYDQQVDAVVRNNNMLKPTDGENNYSEPPIFAEDGIEMLSLSSVYYRPEYTTTALTNHQYKENELANRAVRIGSKWTAIKSNDSQSITVWGNFSGAVKFYIAPTYTLVRN